MSNEAKENPVFATKFISKFTHYMDADADLVENIEMETVKDISYVLLPIVDQVPEKGRGIVRILITNNSGQPISLALHYSLIGWYSDLSKTNKSTKIETITILPKEVWFRDISFISNIKQGKNYFKIIFKQKRKEYATTNIEYSQIREIEDEKQIERSNFLGMQSKPFINPHSINYWIYYSLFGPYRYRKERTILQIIKFFGVVAGGILVGLYFPYSTVPERPLYPVPIGIGIILISLLSFLSNFDASKVKLIKKLKLTDQERKGALEYTSNTIAHILKKFTINDINFSYDADKNTVNWKEGANKLFQRIIPDIGNMLGITTDIGDVTQQVRPDVEVIKDREELKKKISEGIELQHEEGIRLTGVVGAVGEGSEGVTIETDDIRTESSIQEDIESIKTTPEMKQDIKPIQTTPELKQDIEPIKTKTDIEQKIEPLVSDTSIKTKTQSVVDDARGYIGELTDVETIPIPKDIPGHEFKTKSKKSVKELKKDED